MDFVDKVAVVTAGANGIGRACAIALAREGSHVVIADIDQDGAREVSGEIGRLGRDSLAIRCDVRSDDDIRALADQVVGHFGRVDLLHNHAGVGVGGAPEQIPLEEWERVLAFNVVSQVRGVMTFLPYLKQGGGYVINTTSSLGIASGHPISPLVVPYITSKTAILGLTQCLAVWLRPQGVGVSLLAPDYTNTNFDKTIKFFEAPANGPDVDGEGVEANVPYDIQQPEEVARVYISGLRKERFLLSSTPDIEGKLRRQAEGLLDPASLRGAYDLQ